MKQSNHSIGFVEFVTLMALITSLVALSIDTMLPALPEIAADLDVQEINDSQFVISMLFAGMALGQMIFGPMSDHVGRKLAINIGFLVFMIGCLMSLFARDFDEMLVGQFLQGFGAAGPRIVSIALVRDEYEGREMARVMSFVMSIFILVPVLAPSLGQLILVVADWRAIFTMFLVLTVVVGIWFIIRQRETLPAEKRRQFSFLQMMLDIKTIVSIRVTTGYTLATGLIFGAFIGYLSSSQQIFQVQYELGEQFAIYFGVLATSIGIASLVNAKLVMRFGMRRLSHGSMLAIILISIPFVFVTEYYSGHPPLALLMVYLLSIFFFMGILFGNLNALAMEPLGFIAGLGAAVIGSATTAISVVLGVIVSSAYDNTVLPLVSGFAVFSSVALIIMQLTEKLSNSRAPGH